MPQHEKTSLRGFANNKGADQPAYPHGLISAFVIRLFESIISKLATGEISSFLVVSVAETHFVKSLKDRFSRVEVHIHGLQFLNTFMFTKLVKRCSLYSLLFWYRFCKLKNYS